MTMTRPPSRSHGGFPLPFFLLAAIAVIAASSSAHAQSASAVFSGPQNMDQGLQSGLNNIIGYVYSILKFLSLIGLGIAYYFVTHHGVGKAILATIAAILLWFAPTVANIAENIGSAAAQQSLGSGQAP
jgi:fucose 4-O-acetylase-like acetyltransferase